MFHRDTFRLIKNTFNRFFSLFMIVLVGTSFMMGLFSSATILKESADVYFDRNNLQDLQLYSSYGFCLEDVGELKKDENIKDVFPSKTIDVYATKDFKNEMVVRVEELNRKINNFELLEGRMPKSPTEALMLVNAELGDNNYLGGSYTLYINDENIKDYLKHDTFVVVGICKSPEHLSNVLGSSNRDNQDLDAVFYIYNSNFISDYYTTIYLTFNDADKMISYSDEYNELIENNKVGIEAIKNKQQSYLRDKIYIENEEKLINAQREFEDKKKEGEDELAKAKQKLDDANIELIVAQSQLDANKSTIEISQREIEVNERLLQDNERLVNNGISELEKQTGQSFDVVYAEVSAAYTSYHLIKDDNNIVGNYSHQLRENLEKEREDNNKKIEELNNQINSLDESAENYIEQRIALELERQNYEIRNEVIKTTLENYTDNIENNTNQTKEQLLASMDANFNGSVDKTYFDIRQLYEGREKIISGRAELEAGKASLENAKKQIEEGQKQIDNGRREYNNGLFKYEESVLLFNDEIEKGENELKKAREELEALPNASWMILDRDLHYSSYMYKNTINQMAAIGYALPFLFYLVAALVCMTTMTRLVDEQRSQIGIFRALGFSNISIIGKYVLYALLASIGGSIIGIIIGQMIFPTVIYETWKLMYNLPDIKFFYPPIYVIVCILAFSTLMMFVTFLVVSKTLKEVPSQLLRPKAPKNSKRVILEKISLIWDHLSFTSKITARNIFRYKSRFLMTVIGVAGCTALLVVGFGIKDSISDIVKIQYGDIFSYDYQINLENDHNLETNINTLKDNLDNEEVVPFMTYTTRAYMGADEDTLSVEVIDAREAAEILHLRETDLKTEIKLNNNGIVLSHKFAINHNLHEGDYITIESQSGLKRDVRIEKICEFYFQHYIFMSDSFYEDIFGEKVHKNQIAISTLDNETLVKDASKLKGFISIFDFTMLIEQFETMIRALDFIILVIVLAAGSLAFVVLINLIQVNISERIREIATLKVLGFHNVEVNGYIFKEILLLTIIGALCGLPLGVIEHHFIMNVINMDMMMFGMNISLFSFLISFAITIIFTFIVFLFTKRHLRNIEMVESLKSVE